MCDAFFQPLNGKGWSEVKMMMTHVCCSLGGGGALSVLSCLLIGCYRRLPSDLLESREHRKHM